MVSCKLSLILNAFMAIFWLLMSWFVFLGTSKIQQGDLVSAACNSTLYVEVCVSSLRSDPRSQTSDLTGLDGIALNLSIAHGVETLAYINDLHSQSKSGSSDPQNKSNCLNECREEYDEAVETLQDSIHALNIRFYDKVNTLVSTAMTDSDTCEGCFRDLEDTESPLTERSQYFNQLCSNFLAITKLLL